MDNFGVAFLVLAVLILLYIYSPARKCIKKLLPWAALLGIGFVAGLLITAGESKPTWGGGDIADIDHESLEEDEEADSELDAFLAEEGYGNLEEELEIEDITDDGVEDADITKFVVAAPEEALNE